MERDIFQIVSRGSMVRKVSNLFANRWQEPLNLLFYICPALKDFKLNPAGLGFYPRYGPGLGKGAAKRVNRALLLARFLEESGVSFILTAIFAAADALFLSSPPAPTPLPPSIDGLRVVSNYDAFAMHLDVYYKLYRGEPWRQNVASDVLVAETDRLRQFLPAAPSAVEADFLRRTFAGFAMDGWQMKQGLFGPNPIILGVETEGVVRLQNTLFAKKDCLPAIQLN